jgi:ABC-type oligopeptide transport system substrate-binding subunit
LSTNVGWQRECHITAWNWVTHLPDPEYFLRNLLHTASGSKLGHWSCPEFDNLIDRALMERDGARRLALFHAADRLAVRDEALVIPIGYRNTMAWMKPWVHGWHQWGSPKQSFDEITIDPASPRFSGA